jgi:hypothetical protein
MLRVALVVSDEADIISRLAEVDVLVTMALIAEIGRTATHKARSGAGRRL